MIPQHTLNNYTSNLSTDDSALSLEDAKALGDEYGELMISPTLSDQQEARIDHILHLATIHENVDFWVSRAACDRGAEIGLLSPQALHHYENQRTILRERIDLDGPVEPVAETVLHQQVKEARDAAIQAIYTATVEKDPADNGAPQAGPAL